MSHAAHPSPQLRATLAAHRVALLAALLALLATAAVVLVLAVDSDPASTPAVDQPQPAARVDGGPEESSVAASVGTRPVAVGPDESTVAAAVASGRETPAARPDESSAAAAISGG
jgi:hypothetical protein